MKLPTVPQATGAGFAFGVAAALLWVAFARWPEAFVLAYVIALAATASCGIYVLLATSYDSYRNPRRGARIRPIRGFDIVSGLILAGPALYALYPFLPAL